jgi:hypothetical protein
MGIEAALIGAGASLLGGSLASRSAGKAADTQAASQDAAIQEQRRQYDQTREDLSQYRQVGGNALQQLYGQIGQDVTPQEVMQDPGYQFGMDQGLQALARRQSAMGGRVSGQAMKAATQFGTNYATTGYNSAYQRRQDRLNRLAAIAGIGQTATGASAAAGGNSANAISSMLMQGGQNQGAAQLAQGNIWGNAANDIAAQYLRRQQIPGQGASFGNQLNGFFGGTGGSGD